MLQLAGNPAKRKWRERVWIWRIRVTSLATNTERASSQKSQCRDTLRPRISSESNPETNSIIMAKATFVLGAAPKTEASECSIPIGPVTSIVRRAALRVLMFSSSRKGCLIWLNINKTRKETSMTSSTKNWAHSKASLARVTPGTIR